MCDWLLNAAKRLHLTKASLDIFQVSFDPTELNIRPLTLNAKDLKAIIDKELLANGFETTFIKEAVIDFQFPDPKIYRTTFYCFPYLVDIDGKRYESGRIIEEGLEPEFNPFDELNINPTKRNTNIIEKIRNLFG